LSEVTWVGRLEGGRLILLLLYLHRMLVMVFDFSKVGLCVQGIERRSIPIKLTFRVLPPIVRLTRLSKIIWIPKLFQVLSITV
jgi:hypothetical protein